eukprot:6784231-Prymnesium_polylepis.1
MTPCAPGKHASNAQARVCAQCAVSKYSLNEGQAECDVCPANTLTIATGSYLLTACYCEPTFFTPNLLTDFGNGVPCQS